MVFSKIVLNGTKLTKESFQTPPKEMGILPFWFWNGELEEKEMEWQMREYKDKGITGLFIHGRFGLKVPYLSEDWFERVKYVVKKAKEIGIDVWVYDEMNWPSGTAERQVLQKYPALKQKYLELVVLDVYGPLFTFLEATDHRYVNTGDSTPIAAFACTAEEFENGIKNIIDLTPNLSFNKVIPWEAPAGHWKLLYFLEKEVDYYIDTLNPESTNRFIELTHDKYKTAVGKDFGSIVPGFYTDEPAMYYYQVGVDNYVIPWSSQMFKIFRTRRGYDLKAFLPALYTSMGEKTVQIRYDFWRTLTEQYKESYYKRLRDWCEENGVIFTGHLLFEDWLRAHARCEGNIFKYLKQMHLIGVDHLYPKIGSEKEPAEHVALKIGSSAAHHFGSTRLLCESMGGTYWDCTLERMKWIANWEYVLGVNLFNNHGYHYSIEGERKRDWPPSQFYHHTWWKYYDRFTTYMSRLGHILSGGKHIAKLLVLYPINSTWINYVPQKNTPENSVTESDFNYLTDTLLRLHYDFDYVDEDVLAEAQIKDGKIIIADEEYELFILPPVTHIKRSTFEQLHKFVHSGGKLIADTLLPISLLEADNDFDLNEIEELFGINPEMMLDNFKNGAQFDITKKNTSGKVCVIHGKGLYTENKKEKLDNIISECIVPDVIINNEKIFYLHRIKDDYNIYFFVNTTQDDISKVEISFEQVAKPELWDPNTGEITPLHNYLIKNNRLLITLDFPATESVVVVLKDNIEKPFISDCTLKIDRFDEHALVGYPDGPADHVSAIVETKDGVKELTAPVKPEQPPLKLSAQMNFHLEDDNVLSISKWKMKEALQNEPWNDYVLPDFDDSGWLDVSQGAWEMQLPQERDEAVYPVTLWYRTSFEIAEMPSNTRLLIDGFSGREYQLFINGSEIDDEGERCKFDAEIRQVPIQSSLKPGRNVVAVKLVVTRRTDGMLDLLKIVGDFALAQSGNEFKIVGSKSTINVGDWTKQGYPFFSGTGCYQTQFDIPGDYLKGKLFLQVDCGEDVLEVIINESESVIVPWHPYRIDVTNMVKPGRNKIQFKVTNTLINMLEAVQKNSGIKSEPQLIHKPVYRLSF
ncbi:hypothetical protein JXQ31_15405 [candidate division KSB1 bacterium]|nr:hypothetical protein [candidate division KSB1 bacterium]